jgi:hypothetical protein
MVTEVRRWLDNPAFLLALIAALAAFVVQSGELGNADTMHRLQTAHSFWTGEPAVFPREYPEFGVHGRGGKIYDWYGIGQPLLLLPSDIVGTYLDRWSIFEAYQGTDPTVRNVVVSYSTNIALAVLTALLCLRFLRQLEFSTRQAAAGVLALLFCTTHLHYTQNMMENNYILLLTLAGFSFLYEWLRSGRRRALWIGSASLGLNLLTRLTTGLELIAAGVFLWLVLRFEGETARAQWQRFLSFAKSAFPIYALFLLVDRWYQYHRFGTIFDTYVRYFTAEHRLQDPSLPSSYPFETPFHVGFLGPLISAEKSIFLFDPLLVATLLVSFFAWKHFRPEIKAYLVTAWLLLLAYISFYAKYTVWSGDFAWGDRYVSTAVEFAAFISVPLLLRHRAQLASWVWGLGMGLVAASAFVQLCSLAFWLPLEIYQMETLGHPTFVIALRVRNIVAFELGKMDAWGLTNHAMTEDPWDYVHITTWNFLPFVLRRVGGAPGWVVKLAFAVWGAALAALAGAFWQLSNRLRS